MTPSVSALMQEAKRRAGLSNFGDDWFIGPLSAWAADLEGDHLSEVGRAFLARLAINDLIRRLHIIDCIEKNPEILDTPIPPILYITGHERSGTTILHNLLSLHRDARFLSRWELMRPTPPPEAESFGEDGRREKVQASIEPLRGSDLESMHWVDAGDPEECFWGFMDCTGLLGTAPGAIMPRWVDWLRSNDLTPTFRSYRKIVQLLTWKNPVAPEGFLVLKAPQMSAHLPEFAGVFPEATFLYTHRDPYRVLTSTCTLVEIVDRPFLEDPSYIRGQEEQHAQMLETMRWKLTCMQRFEDHHPERVINIRYDDLVDSPVEQVLQVLERMPLARDPALGDEIDGFLARQRAGRRAKPRKEIDSFGYERADVLADPSIAAYMERYGLAPETQRKTGVERFVG